MQVFEAKSGCAVSVRCAKRPKLSHAEKGSIEKGSSSPPTLCRLRHCAWAGEHTAHTAATYYGHYGLTQIEFMPRSGKQIGSGGAIGFVCKPCSAGSDLLAIAAY